MILLNGKSITPKKKVPLEALSLQLKERDSTASMTPTDMDGIQIGSWLKDEGSPGANIVWRVRSIGTAYATNTPTVQLEHAVSILKDEILFGEHKAAQITGNSRDTDCTAEAAIRYILKRSPEWTLGRFDFGNVRNPYRFDGETLFEALQTVTNSLDDAWWSYDFSSYPFKLNITKQNTAVSSELRAGRNLNAITKNIDKSGMYTRFYPIGKNNLHISGDYVERNASTYGVVSKVETDQSIDSESELRRWANERLKKHAQPTVTIDVDGLELADATGEKMDRLTLGTVCRIPLPEFGTTMTERIVGLTYNDKLNQPEVVKVTLANQKNDVAKIIAEMIRGGGGGGRAAAEKAEEDLAWFEDTNDHVAMCAKGIVGRDENGEPNWEVLSRLVVDGNGLDSQVREVKEGVELNSSRITQTQKEITLEVNERKSQNSTMSSKISQLSNKISLVVTEKNGKDVINTASIVLGINNQTGSYVKIAARNINLDGYVTAKEFNAAKAEIDNLKVSITNGNYIHARTIDGTNVKANGGLQVEGRWANWRTIEIDGVSHTVLGA